jgi:hypothetical protein
VCSRKDRSIPVRSRILFWMNKEVIL